MRGPDSEVDSLARLRDRLVAVAGRRVPPAAVEDIVQTTLQIILERGSPPPTGSLVEGIPALEWCFQVLRHTIGNFYQREKTRRTSSERVGAHEHARVTEQDGLTPLEALEAEESRRLIRDAIRSMRGDGTGCADYFERMLEGRTPAELASEAGIAEAALYRRIYRCREKLREILRARGVGA